MIVVDSNERDTVKKYLDQLKIPYEVERIVIDDEGVGDYTNREQSFLAERKTAFDYRQSLLNNHLEVQLSRMVRLFDGPKYLIFEGDLQALIESEHNKGIKALMFSFPLRLAHVYGVSFVQTFDAYETATVLELLDKYTVKIKDAPVKFEPIHVQKTKDERVRNLMTIPRLGQKNAELLLEKFGSIQNIVEAAIYEPKKITEIRGIGKTIVEKIVAMYTSIDPFERNKKRVKKDRKDEYARMRRKYKQAKEANSRKKSDSR